MTPMKTDLRRLAAVAALSLHCGGATPEPASAPTPAAPAPSAAAANPAMAQQPVVKLRPVTQEEFDRCVAMLKEAREAAKAGGPNGANQYVQLLEKHGFIQPTFMEVHQNISRAYGAIVNAERLAAMPRPPTDPSAQSGESVAAPPPPPPPDAFGEIPPENIELVRAHRAEFEAAVGKGGQ
jgi:hypothetical protein